jgi:hypothetical protein
MVGGARVSPSKFSFKAIIPSRRTPPPPCLRMVPLPRFTGEDERHRSRDAPLRPSFAHHHQATKESFETASGTHDPEKCSCGFRKRSCAQKGSGAPKGASLQWPCVNGARQRALSEPARLPALHRGTRQRGRNRLWLSSRTAFPGTARAGVLPASATSPMQPAPGRPVLLPAEQGPGAARERSANPRAGTALAPQNGMPRELRPLNEQGDSACNTISDDPSSA